MVVGPDQPTPIYDQLCFERDSGGINRGRHWAEPPTPDDHPATSPGQHPDTVTP